MVHKKIKKRKSNECTQLAMLFYCDKMQILFILLVVSTVVYGQLFFSENVPHWSGKVSPI